MFSNSLKSDWTICKLAKSRFAISDEMSSFGKVFKISIELDVHFVKWNPQFCNYDDICNIVDRSLKESK